MAHDHTPTDKKIRAEDNRTKNLDEEECTPLKDTIPYYWFPNRRYIEMKKTGDVVVFNHADLQLKCVF